MIEDPFTHKSARPTVKVSIEGLTSLALFDTGAKITAMSETFFTRLSTFLAKKGSALRSVNIPPMYVISASSHKALVSKAFLVPMYIEGTYKCWRVLVLQHLSSELILGQDFLSFYGAKLCCRTHKISWEKSLRKIPPPDFCLERITPIRNRFDVLSEQPIVPVSSLSHPYLLRKKKRETRERNIFLHAIKHAKRKTTAHMHDHNVTFALHAQDNITLPPLSSNTYKVGVSSLDGTNPSIVRKTIGIVQRDPILSQQADILCLEGLYHVTPTKSGPVLCVQLTNLSTEYKYLQPNETFASFSPLTKGSELYDISVIKAITHSPIVPRETLSPGKKEYLESSVRICAPDNFKNAYHSLMLEFHDIFAENKDDIGHTDLVTHRIHLKNPNQPPIYKKQFPVPWAHQEFIQKKVDDMLRQGIIEESYSPFNSPIFAVKKPHSDDLRLVVDMREINNISYCTNFRVRCVQECVDEISKHESSIFSTLDISQAFYQVSLEPESRPLTSFTVPGKGSFMFTRLPMGLHGSPATLSRVTNFIVRDLPSIIAYLDDLIAHSKSHESQLHLLRQLFMRLRQHGIKLQAKKTVLGADSVVYLGYRISAKGIQPGEEKIEAIKQFPPPQNIKQIRQFCGLANYFRHMIPNFSTKSGQLTKLIQKNSTWKGGVLPEESFHAFLSLKKDLSSYPVLAFPDPRKTFHVFTDGAIGSERESGGLGAVLCQKNKYGVLHPVAYASRSLHANEKNYSAFLIEMSAIVFAIQHWHTYLYGRFFYVYCDHKPIEKLNSVHKKTMNRLQELMLEYNFELKYNPGANNGPADALSRNPISALGTDVDIPLAQAEDPFCESMVKYLSSGLLPVDVSLRQLIVRNANRCSVERNGTLTYNLERKNFIPRKVIIVPLSFQQPLIRAAHCSRFSGHLGIFKTVNRLFMNYWWPGIQDHVVEFIKECENCQLSKTPPNFKREVLPSHPLPILDQFNERVHIDTIGKMRGTRNPWLLVITCAFSKYVIAVPIVQRDAETQAQAIFEHWICRFGVPKTIVHDGDPAYCGELFQKLCRLMNTKTIQISSYHCQSNGGVEVYNKVFQSILRSMLNNPTEPYEPWLPVVSLAYNSSVNQATNSSPFFMLYGCDPNLPQFDGLDISPYNIDYPAERLLQLKKAHENAREQLALAAKKNKEYYDRFSKECSFQLGERCLLHFPRTVCLQGHSKFFKQWHPVVVTRILNQTTYMVRKLARTRSRANRESMVHANRLKKFFPVEILPQFVHSSTAGRTVNISSPPPQAVLRDSRCPRVRNLVDSSKKAVAPEKLNSDTKDHTHRYMFAASPAVGIPTAARPRDDPSPQAEEPDQGFVHLPLRRLSSDESSFASFGDSETEDAGAASSAPPPPSTSQHLTHRAAPAPGSAGEGPAAAAAHPASSTAAASSSARGSSSSSFGPRNRGQPSGGSQPAREPASQPAGHAEGPLPPGSAGPHPQRAVGGSPVRPRRNLGDKLLGPLAEGLYGPGRSTRSNSKAPDIPSLPKRPPEYKSKKK